MRKVNESSVRAIKEGIKQSGGSGVWGPGPVQSFLLLHFSLFFLFFLEKNWFRPGRTLHQCSFVTAQGPPYRGIGDGTYAYGTRV